MNSSRISRRLDLKSDAHSTNDVDRTENNTDIKKSELRKLFEDEIASIIEDEKNSLKKRVQQELEVEFDLQKNKLEKIFNENMDVLNNEKSKLDALVTTIKKSYQDKISEDISMLDELVIELTMQSLYKIIGDASIYKEVIDKNIHEVLEKKSADSRVLIKVSENEMRFLKKNFVDSTWINCLRVDEKLTDGEMVLDDGIASLYEIGFVNQLDVLRAAFIKLLREQHAS